MNILQDTTHEKIKYLLRVSGTSFADIARELQVSGTVVAAVSSGKGRSRRIERAIADKLDTNASELWPSRYCCPNCGVSLEKREDKNG